MQRYEVIRKFLSDLKLPEARINGEGPFPCPLHGSTKNTLFSMICDGSLYFRCTKCKFVGSPTKLARLTPAPIKSKDQVVAQLHMGVKDVSIQSPYDDEKQEGIQSYLDTCRERFNKLNIDVINRVGALGVNRMALTEWVKTCGLVASPAPTTLPFLKDGKYTTSDYLTLPFYRGSTVTHLGLYCPALEDFSIKRVTAGCEGIFLERELSWPVVNRAIVCSDPLDALVLYSKFAEFTSEKMNVISVTDVAALRALPALSTVCLVQQDAKPLTLSSVLRFMRAGRASGVSTYVNEVHKPMATLSDTELMSMYDRAVPASEYVCNTVVSSWKSGGRNAVVSLLTNNPFTEIDREDLCAAIESKELLAIVQSVSCTTAESTVGGQVRIRRDQNGFKMLEPVEKQLTNFSVFVDSCTDNAKGELQVSMRVRTDTAEEGFISVQVPLKELTVNGSRFGKNVWAQCIRVGTGCSFYSKKLPTGLDWLTVLREMDQFTFKPGVHRLGVYDGKIQFPGFRLSIADKSLHRSDGAVTIEESARKEYGAITLQDAPGYGVFSKLLASDNPSVQALTACLCHCIHGLVTAASRPDSVTVNHLLLHAQAGCESPWVHTIKQLSSIFSGFTESTTISTVPSKSHPCKDEESGGLPLVGQFDWDAASADNELFSQATRPIVAVASTQVALTAATSGNVSVITTDADCFSDTDDVTLLSAEILEEIRAALPHVLRDILAKAAPTVAELHQHVPAQGALAWIERVVAKTSHPGYRNLVSSWQVVQGVNSADVFVNALSMLVRSGVYTLAMNHRKGRDSENLGYVTEDHAILWQSRCIAAVNGVCGNLFDRTGVSQSIEEEVTGWQDGVDTLTHMRQWSIPIEAWRNLTATKTVLTFAQKEPVTTVAL